MTRPIAIGLCVFVVLVAPLIWLAALVDHALRTTPHRRHTIGWWTR